MLKNLSNVAFRHTCRSNTLAPAVSRLQHRQIQTTIAGASAHVQGRMLEYEANFDFREARVGTVLDIPYELTAESGWTTAWQSSYYQHDRLYTSDQFAQALKLRAKVLPFSLMAFLTGSMTHVDEERNVLDVGLRNAVYERPAFEGDTFTKQFTVKNIRPTSDGKRTIIDFRCDLNRQDGERVFTLEKTILFPEPVNPTSHSRRPESASKPPPSHLLAHIKNNVYELPASSSIGTVQPGELILHQLVRPIGLQASMGLASLFRMTHPLLYNTSRFSEENLIVPWGLVMAGTHAATAKAFYEVLVEEVLEADFLHTLSPQEPLGAISYVLDVKDIAGILEEVTVQTIGVKNVDVWKTLAGQDIPVDMFGHQGLRKKEYDELCKSIPALKNNIVFQSTRRMVRQLPSRNNVFLL